MTDPRFCRDSPYSSFVRVDDKTMDDLKEFLQDMMKTIEFLCARHDAAREALKTSVFVNPDRRTTLSIGMPSISLRTSPTGEKVPRTHFRGDMSGFTVPSLAFQPPLNSEQLFFRQRYDEGKLNHMQGLFAQNSTFDARMPGQKSNNLEERRLIAATCETEVPIQESNVGIDSQDHSSAANDADNLRALLEDMKMTIQAWCAMHNLLNERTIPARRDADMHGAELGETPEAICPRSHTMDHVEQGVDRNSCPPDKDKDAAITQLLDLPDQKEEEASRSRKDKQEAEGECFVQIQEGKETDKSFSLAVQENVDSNECLLHEQISSQLPPHGNEPPPQQKAGVQESLKAAMVGCRSSSPIHLEEDPVQHNSNPVLKEINVEPINDSREVDNFATPKADRAETKIQKIDCILETKTEAINDDSARGMKIQPYRRKVDVVDSPDWLPKGWITEVKTRISGNSAGSKDKYYFDPVSKRRFRSKKEVFCFLETGKLGRYKSKPKVNPVKLLETELPSPGQVIDSREARPAKRVRKTSSKSQQPTSGVAGPSNVPAVVPPAGLLSNLFMPYRPGQPSDWLVYESLASLPVPVFEHFRYAEYCRNRSSSNKGPAIGPWFFSNPEGSWRPVFDKSYFDKCAEKSKDVQGFQFHVGAQGFETKP